MKGYVPYFEIVESTDLMFKSRAASPMGPLLVTDLYAKHLHLWDRGATLYSTVKNQVRPNN